jgi:hypothetical protein
MAGNARITDLPCLLLLVVLVFACCGRPMTAQELADWLMRPEYMPSGDGWAEARRRRLVTRYLGQMGFQVRAVQRPYSDGRIATKYRQVDLVASRGEPTAAGAAEKATLALVLPEERTSSHNFAQRQKECDRHLLSVLQNAEQYRRLELVTAPVCFGLTAQSAAQE